MNSTQLPLGVGALELHGVNDTKIESQLEEEAEQQSSRTNLEDQTNVDQGVGVAKSKLKDAISSTSSMEGSGGSKEKSFNVETTPSPTMKPILVEVAKLRLISRRKPEDEIFLEAIEESSSCTYKNSALEKQPKAEKDLRSLGSKENKNRPKPELINDALSCLKARGIEFLPQSAPMELRNKSSSSRGCIFKIDFMPQKWRYVNSIAQTVTYKADFASSSKAWGLGTSPNPCPISRGMMPAIFEVRDHEK
ncbi:hypothetical protein CRG98_022755 [Punica granatum]|uniref:Uncharacterized protein n=1 Tax=Punica granatum TaxID=22663 RepID=A0A2I0JKS6_PUNGR|nr:hypothetical protein CRG98_022755 [Punica granatum]